MRRAKSPSAPAIVRRSRLASCIFDSDTIPRPERHAADHHHLRAGVVGCEYVDVSQPRRKGQLVNTREKLLEFLDDEIIDALAYHMRDRGVLLRHAEEYERIEGLDDGVVLHLKSGKALKTDILLWANGRSGNVEELDLEKVGLQPNSRGQLEVNENFRRRCRTSTPSAT
jgi:NAD(P) transhydrogenase